MMAKICKLMYMRNGKLLSTKTTTDKIPCIKTKSNETRINLFEFKSCFCLFRKLNIAKEIRQTMEVILINGRFRFIIF